MRRPPRVAMVVASVVIGCWAAYGQEPLPPIQFGVPYRCADGTVYVFERCEPARRGEVCFYRIEQAGQLPTSAYNVRAWLTGILTSCPAQAPAQQPVPAGAPAAQQRAAPAAPAAVPRPQPASQSGQRSDALLAPDDPGERAARRCVELGGGELECAGKGFVKGLLGGGVDELLSAKNRGRAGMMMTGIYEAGGLRLTFSDDDVTIDGCGKLVSESRPYSVAVAGTGFAVTVEGDPKPIRLNLGAAGVLAGPGPVDVKGKIITGYQQVWMQQYRNGSPLVAGECGGGPCGYWTQQPVYAPKTERCTFGAMRPSGPSFSAQSPIAAIVGGVSGQLREDLPGPGVRMFGKYSGAGGLLLEFDVGRVVLDCGEAHAAKPYTVEFSAGQGVVHVANDATPFTAVVQPDGRLAGSGTTDVLGRVVSSVSAGGIAFSPRRARCAVDTLAPGSGATAAGGARAPLPGREGPASLSLASRFPTQPGNLNPLGSVTMYVLRESFADIVLRSGVRPAAGQSALEAWGAACSARAPECAQARQAVQSSLAATTTLDTDGRGTFDALPAGSYHLFGWISYEGQHLVWDLPVTLKAGSNGVALEPANAVAMK